MVWLILGCEIAFWLLILVGLSVRYLAGHRTLGLTLLAAAPLIDLVLLGASAVSARQGDPLGLGHALAPIYIGFSVAHGKVLIRWADVRFAHLVGGGAAPVRATGRAHTLDCWRDLARTVLAAAVTMVLTAGMIVLADSDQATAALSRTHRWMAVVVVAEALWALSFTIWPRPATATDVSRGTVAEDALASKS
ncbi:MAG TPA: hypothetical protein H9987_02225 [Candidatus Luteococcus avicola]|nr:hypothetical protein [Candidatus Luteococcus avicola]